MLPRKSGDPAGHIPSRDKMSNPEPSKEWMLDCGDSSCEFAEAKAGMRTNGGCRCLSDLPRGLARSIRFHMQTLRLQSATLRSRAEQAEARVAELEGDVARLRKRTHEIADDGHRRVSEVQRQMSPALIHATLDKEGREEVQKYLAAMGCDPTYADANRFMPYSLSHNSYVAVHELLRTIASSRARLAKADELATPAEKLCEWIRHTESEWTPEVDKYLEATEAASAAYRKESA